MNLSGISVNELQQELLKRSNYNKISNPSDLILRLKKFSTKRQEHFFVVSLNGAHNIIKITR